MPKSNETRFVADVRGGNAHPGRPDIPALTGLRFFAAFFVAISHTLVMIYRDDASSGPLYYVASLSGIGMTLFFVLSGFVIHYNYQETITSGGASGYWRFFAARFSRLYPLYFVLMAWEIANRGFFERAFNGDEAAIQKLLVAGPYYLTLSQSWFFSILGENNLIYQFHRVGSIAWSISTEWFFYLASLLSGVFRTNRSEVSDL